MRTDLSVKGLLCPKLTLSLFLLILLVSSSTILSAQEAGSFNDETGITLKSDQENLPYTFTIQLNEQYKDVDWKPYLKDYNNELTTLEYDETKHTFSISIEKRMKPNWTIENWNEHLSTLHCKAINNLK